MRSVIRVVSFVLFAAASFASSDTASAQSLSPCIRQVSVGFGREIFMTTRVNQRPAYTATVKQSFEQTLSDGNTIHYTIEAIQARDEAGRTMRQRIEGCEPDSGGQLQFRIQTTIFDPALKATTSWGTGPGTMALTYIFHQQQQPIPPDWRDIPRTPSAPSRAEVTHEDLGTRTIAGMETTGRRITEVIPAGREGNDMPIKVVRETWTNPQNHATLSDVYDDPRIGRRTWEVESLTVGPPDPALFNPPANYKVWDQNAQTQTASTATTP